MNLFEPLFEYKLIYIFEIRDESHKGLLKIGDATIKTDSSPEELFPSCKELNQAALNRIKNYTNTAGIEPILLYTELAVKEINTKRGTMLKAFRDHDVHKVLENSNIQKAHISGSTSKEWFKVTLETAIKAIKAVKNNQSNLSNVSIDVYAPIIFRPEQEEAITKTISVFKKNNKMLWNAKMRFGKTLTALEVIKRLNLKKSIIITHRPVVDNGWYDDFNKIFHGQKDYIYGSKNSGYKLSDLLSSGKNIVYFASIQDLRGSSSVGGKFEKNDDVFDTIWDLVIVDEAHEGTTTALGDDVIKKIVKLEDNDITKFLALSGTPFNILTDYDADSIYTWDYIMEQERKNKWDLEHFGDSNPYDELPQLKIYTYDLGKIINNVEYEEIDDKAFNFREFFRVWSGDKNIDKKEIPSDCSIGDFVHKKDINSFLNLITKDDENSNYPYSKKEYRDLFKHSLWMVPGVKEAKALSVLLKQHPIFSSFNIVNVAGDGDDDVPSDDALRLVRNAIDEAGKDGYTITLSCGKLTTGVTIPEWTAVMMMSGSYSTSAANYLQTIFRVQSPCNIYGKIKTASYVFDFAPDRTLKMVAESVAISTKAGKTSGTDKVILGNFLNYCPVISIDGSKMNTYSTNKLLQQLKRAYAERAVRNGFDDTTIYNDELLKLDGVALEEFQKLKGIIGSSKASHKTNEIDINRQGFTDEEYEELEVIEKKPVKNRTPEELARLEELRQRGKNKKDAISILRGISIRMPLLIYGADVDFSEDISINQLTELVDDSSWEEFMPAGVTKEIFNSFIKYYDSEIFIEAGRNIRKVVKSADECEPLERIKKISELFNCFKNPDKETVLTPWRVVNMHLSSAIGGYNFYDDDFKEQIDEPKLVDHGTITAGTITNTSTKILEINSKTGLYPLYVTYSIYKTKCNNNNNLSDEDKEKIWDETVSSNVFVVCKTPMAKSITKRTLVGFKDKKINAHYFDDLINYLKNKPDKFIERVLKPNYWGIEGSGKMKFNAIVGNPPYQETNVNNSRDISIYNLFMDSAFKISDVVSFITPARFLFNAGSTPKDWNNKVLNDEHFKVVWYKADSNDVFPSVDIKGGVAVTLRNENENYGKIGVFTPNADLKSILDKVLNSDSFKSFTNIVYTKSSYTFTDVLYKEHPEFKTRLTKGNENIVDANIFNKIPEIFVDDNPNSDDYIRIYGRDNNNRVYKWMLKKYLSDNTNLFKYKVFITGANGTGAMGETLSYPIVAEPGVGHTQTFMSIGAFDEKENAKACLKYIKTKFARCLLSTLKVTQNNPRDTWGNIPIQNFSNNSDIDWNKSVHEIDLQLYKKYGLTENEIDFIETNIKEME